MIRINKRTSGFCPGYIRYNSIPVYSYPRNASWNGATATSNSLKWMDHHENFHSVVEKKVRITFPLSHQNRSQHESTVFFQKLILRNCCPVFSCKKKTRHMSQCAWHVRTCSKLIFKNIITSQFIWVAPNRSHQTCSGLWAPAPGHILRSAHAPTFTVPFQFLTAFKLKQGLSGENSHELNSCLQISYRNSRLNWISRLQSIFLPDCEKVYFLCSAQNISLNGDLGMAIPCLRPSPRTVYKP